MKSLEDAESDIISVVNERQEITYNELKSFASSHEIDDDLLKKSLSVLEKAHAIASRSSGGILTYYILQDKPMFSRILIIEDDKNINRLMALSIGKDFQIDQVYDGAEGLKRARFEKPDLVVLDLMLPGVDGLEICQSIKMDPGLKDTVVIIVSAMDATSNRFKGIRYGADYYIKKPFDPEELRGLVTIFLKKKGKKFDPLIDLPNEERISDAVERALKETQSDYEIGRLRVDGLAGFAARFGNQSGITILRLVSQLLQDKIKENKSNTFVGFLNGNDFVIAGDRQNVEKIIESINTDFSAVLPFVYQNEGWKPMEFGFEDMYGADKPKLSLAYTPTRREVVMERRAEVLEKKQLEGKDIGAYTYEELRHMLGGEDLDITLTRTPDGIRLSAGKSGIQPKKQTDEKKGSEIPKI